jgi:DNA-binding transcriptional LysR family regulator
LRSPAETRGVRVYPQALEAALAGGGIAMIDMAYLAPHLARGTLRLLGPPVTLDEGYYLVSRPVRHNDRYLGAFERWLLAAAAQHEAT